MIGTVIPGDGRGTKIGFPTANLKLRQQSHQPINGVYACLTQILPDDAVYKAVLHVGPRPTFKGASATVEVHLMDFPQRKLYDSEIKISSLSYIRQIKKFSSPEKLALALTQDIKIARQLLSNK